MTTADRSAKDHRGDVRAVAGAGAVVILFGASAVAVGLYTGWLAMQENFRDLYSAWDLVVSIVAGIALTHLGAGILLKSRLCLILAVVVTALTAAWQAHAALAVGANTLKMIGLGAGPLITLALLASSWGAMTRLARGVNLTISESPADAIAWQQMR